MSETVILTKGGSVSISKAAPGSARFVIGMGWDPDPRNTPDLDIAAYLCDDNDHIVPPVADQTTHGNFVYFHNLVSHDGAVSHSGDNLNGDGDGDDERITIDTSKLDPRVTRIIIGVAIYDAKAKNQTFGLVRHAYANVYEASALEAAEADAKAQGRELTSAELKALAIAHYDLEEEAGQYTAFQHGTFYKTDSGEWKFKALGIGANGDLGTFLELLSPGVAVQRA